MQKKFDAMQEATARLEQENASASKDLVLQLNEQNVKFEELQAESAEKYKKVVAEKNMELEAVKRKGEEGISGVQELVQKEVCKKNLLQDRVDALAKRVKELEVTLQEKEQEISKANSLGRAKKAQKEENLKLAWELQAIQKQLSSLLDEKRQLSQENTTLKSAASKLKVQSERSEKDLGSKARNLEEGNERLKIELQNCKEELQNADRFAQEEMDRLADDLKQARLLTFELEAASRNIEQKEAKIRSKDKEIQSLVSTEAKLQSDLKESNERLKNVSTESEELERRARELSAKVELAEAENKRLQDIAGKRTSLQQRDQAAKIVELTDAVAEKKNELEAVKSSYKEGLGKVRKMVEKKVKENKDLQAQLSNIRQEQSKQLEKQPEIDNLKHQAEELRTRNAKLEDDAQKLKIQLNATNRVLREERSLQPASSEQEQHLQKQLEEKEYEVIRMVSKLSQSQQQHHESLEKEEQLRKRIGKLEKRLTKVAGLSSSEALAVLSQKDALKKSRQALTQTEEKLGTSNQERMVLKKKLRQTLEEGEILKEQVQGMTKRLVERTEEGDILKAEHRRLNELLSAKGSSASDTLQIEAEKSALQRANANLTALVAEQGDSIDRLNEVVKKKGLSKALAFANDNNNLKQQIQVLESKVQNHQTLIQKREEERTEYEELLQNQSMQYEIFKKEYQDLRYKHEKLITSHANLERELSRAKQDSDDDLP